MSSKRHQIRVAAAMQRARDDDYRPGSLGELARLLFDGKISHPGESVQDYLLGALADGCVRACIQHGRRRVGWMRGWP